MADAGAGADACAEAGVEEAHGFQPLQRNSWYGIVDDRFDESKHGSRGPMNREEGATHLESGWPVREDKSS